MFLLFIFTTFFKQSKAGILYRLPTIIGVCADIINDKEVVRHRQLSIGNTESWPNLEQTFLFKF